MLDIINQLECPKCEEIPEKWETTGDIINKRLLNGSIECESGHVWVVMQEVIRFDEENDTSELQFLDHPRTGFPKNLDEQERIDFVDTFEKFVKSYRFENDQNVVIKGNPIMFLKYMAEQSGNFIITHPNEGVLRQLQEIAVKNRLHKNMIFIKGENIGIKNSQSINVFDTNHNADVNILLTSEASGKVIWEGKSNSLLIK